MTLTWYVRVITVYALLQFVDHPCGEMVLSDAENDGAYAMPAQKVTDEGEFLEEHGRFMLGNMNMSVNPCENFYEYACGNWKNNKMVSELGRQNTFFGSMHTQLNKMIVEFLQNTSEMEESAAETDVKRMYESCMNVSMDFIPTLDAMNGFNGKSLPKENDAVDWIRLNFLSCYGLTPLLPTSVVVFHDRMIGIQINAPEATLTKNWSKCKKLVKFEKMLVDAGSAQNAFKEQTIGEFIKAHNSSGIDWNRFFNLAFNRTVEMSWRVRSNVKDFRRLNKFLLRSDKDLMLNYVKRWHTLKFSEIFNEINREAATCGDITIKYFGSLLIPWFIKTAFDEERRICVLRLTKELKDTFYSFLDDYKWLDDDTRSGAKSKLQAMDIMVGYLDQRQISSTAYEKNPPVNVTDNYLENIINIKQRQARMQMDSVGTSYNKLFTQFTVDAQYNIFNELLVPIGLLQLPLYHSMLPYSLKFGGIGSVIGHEIIQAFDSNNFRYDHSGRERNWWSEKSFRNFKERYECLEAQYSKFIYHGVRTDGRLTLGENIGDNGGTRIAYHAYLRFLRENPNLDRADDKPLPGVDFNNKQLFFLKFAQTFCNGRSGEENMLEMIFNQHMLGEFRVVGTLMNMPEFSEEFNCALGTDMNPLRNCQVW